MLRVEVIGLRTRSWGALAATALTAMLAGCGLFRSPLEVTLTASVRAGTPPLTVELSAEVRSAARLPLTFRWELGDGASETGARVTHTYVLPGRYTARVIVRDALGNVGQASETVQVIDFSRVSLALPTGAGPLQAASLDDDAAVDLVVAGQDQGKGFLNVLLNRGGSLAVARTLEAGKRPGDVLVADIDGNGQADVVIADLVNSVVLTFPGTGTGAFREPLRTPIFKENLLVASGPQALAAGDFNADGAVDVVTANQTTDNVSVLLGDGQGRLKIAHGFPPPVPGDLVDLEVADFDEDGLDDLAVLNRTQEQVEIYLGRGDGTFLFFLRFATGARPSTLRVVDLDRDGFPDLLVGNEGSADVSLWWGRGGGLFGFPGRWPAGGPVDRLTLLDVDGDRDEDLVALARASGKVHVLLRRDRAFEKPFAFELGTPLVDLTGADFNGDGRADLAVSDANGQVNLLFNLIP